MHLLSLFVVAAGLIFYQDVIAESPAEKINHLIAKIPACSNPCFHRAVSRICDHFTDFNCQCKPHHVGLTLARIVNCVDNNCNKKQAALVQPTYVKLCDISRQLHSKGKGTGSTSSDDSGLSTGAQAGIGVGVAVAVLAILGVLAWVLLRRRKRRNVSHTQSSEAGAAARVPSVKAELPASNVAADFPPSPAYTHEKDATPTDTMWTKNSITAPSELPGETIHNQRQSRHLYELPTPQGADYK